MRIEFLEKLRCYEKGDIIQFDRTISRKTGTMIQVIVGPNGSGKSTLLDCIKGTYMPESKGLSETSLYHDEYRKMAKSISITECHYDKLYMYDAVKDNGALMDNAFDAVSFIKNGGYQAKSLSHGQAGNFYVSRMIKDLEKDKELDCKKLIILDEIEKGLDLATQVKLHNILYNISLLFNADIICASHNVFLLNMMVVYDLKTRKELTGSDYIEQITKHELLPISL